MPMVKVSSKTLQLIRARRPVGFRFGWAATELEDGSWHVPINDDVAAGIAMERVRGESDDGVVSRVLAHGGFPLGAHGSCRLRGGLRARYRRSRDFQYRRGYPYVTDKT